MTSNPAYYVTFAGQPLRFHRRRGAHTACTVVAAGKATRFKWILTALEYCTTYRLGLKQCRVQTVKKA